MRVKVKAADRYKNPPRQHQRVARTKAKGKKGFALHMEQGTGKTWVAIDEMIEEWNLGNIDGAFVLAPNGVHMNWILRELPKHLPDWVEGARYAFWSSSMTKLEQRAVDEVLGMGKGDPFRLIAVNIEAVDRVERCKEMLRDFCDGGDMAGYLDESSRIKNPQIKRSKFIHGLRNRTVYRRNLSGTPITQSPFDIWSQFQFLDPNILREPSYTAFKTQYGVFEEHKTILTLDDDGKRKEEVIKNRLLEGIAERAKRANPHRPHFEPQIIKRTKDGLPIYKNLDQLAKIIEPYSYRVLKADCLDIPDKTYQRLLVDLVPSQRKLYETVRKELLMEWDNMVSPLTKLTALGRAQQVVCGYVVMARGMPEQSIFEKDEDNPRIKALLELIEDNGDASAIIWARYTEDIKVIARVLRRHYGEDTVGTYFGETGKNARNKAIDDFEARRIRWFVGNQDSGGIGITLNAASMCIYYSNHYGLEARLQSEDRCHRDGQTKKVTYYDIEARGTCDEEIINALVNKKEIADIINGDSPKKWLRSLEG